MATCRKCGAKFGCGCQLIDGLCGGCHAEINKIKKGFKHVISQINRLCSL